MRALICDDESLATQRLTDLLECCEGVELVGTAASGHEALEQTAAARPDILFLDIEMPRLDGFDVVERLTRVVEGAGDRSPLIVFVTAYPHFAAQAFDTGALDFLAKPVRLTRLQGTLERARRALQDRQAGARLHELASQLEALRAEHRRPSEPRNLWIQRRGEMVRVDLDKVDWIGAEGEYVRLHVGELSYLHRDLLSSIMTRLDPQRFLRIHRSFAVNRDRVASIKRSLHGGSKLLLETGIELPIGRTYRTAARSAMIEKRGTAAEAAVPQLGR